MIAVTSGVASAAFVPTGLLCPTCGAAVERAELGSPNCMVSACPFGGLALAPAAVTRLLRWWLTGRLAERHNGCSCQGWRNRSDGCGSPWPLEEPFHELVLDCLQIHLPLFEVFPEDRLHGYVCPDPHVLIGVQGSRRLHCEGPDCAVGNCLVGDALPGYALDIDDHYAQGGAHQRVPSALEGHHDALVRQQQWDQRAQLLLKFCGVDLGCAGEPAQELLHPQRVGGDHGRALAARVDHHRGQPGLDGKDVH
mmetsp:Transcript_31613/g.56735  ORF Transcript_31613/g.56735 Transcript_31613/m.56735 type:complete len:252 (-) Transcript_31613:1864-2619(-)